MGEDIQNIALKSFVIKTNKHKITFYLIRTHVNVQKEEFFKLYPVNKNTHISN